MNRDRPSSARGFTLAEVVVAMGLLALFMGLASVCFASAFRLSVSRQSYARHLHAADALLRRVARDVRAAARFKDQAGDFHSGPSALVLDSDEGVVIYAAGPDGVRRIETAAGGASRAPVLYAAGTRVRFNLEGASAAEARSVVVTVAWDASPGVGVADPMLSLRVALRR